MNSPSRLKLIGELIRCESYLEIGVNYGTTFNSLDFKYKVAVDPKFQFDYKKIQSSHICFHEITSDEYFTKFAKNELFDLIFIDGLHTCDQTLRDFNNALMVSKKSSIIVMDDVYPSDVYSSLRAAPGKYRRMDNPLNANTNWHGDVYKTMFIIHDYYPQISFITIDKEHGNPQSILFRKPRTNFKPIFKSIEQIERMSYFDFLDFRAHLNLKSEPEFIELISKLEI
jgi:hypothetical protein